MRILEGSDTQLKFHITETEGGITTNVDLTQYDKVVLTIKYSTMIDEIDGTIESEEGEQTPSNSYVVFDLLSEQTEGKSGAVFCDIWGISGANRIRFNSYTIQGDILPSIKVPEGNVNE